MSITLEFTPEKEARLREMAARRGQTLLEYLLTLAERDLGNPGWSGLKTLAPAPRRSAVDASGASENSLEDLWAMIPRGGGFVIEPPADAPQTGHEALAYWEQVGAFGAFADRTLFPEDGPELAKRLRAEAEAELDRVFQTVIQPYVR